MKHVLLNKYEEIYEIVNGNFKSNQDKKDYDVFYKNINEMFVCSLFTSFSLLVLFLGQIFLHELGLYDFVLKNLDFLTISFVFFLFCSLMYKDSIIWFKNLEFVDEKLVLNKKSSGKKINITANKKIINIDKLNKTKVNPFFSITAFVFVLWVFQTYQNIEEQAVFFTFMYLFLLSYNVISLYCFFFIKTQLSPYYQKIEIREIERYKNELKQIEDKILNSPELSAEVYLKTKNEDLRKKIEEKHLKLDPDYIAQHILKKNSIKTLEVS